MKKTRLLLPLLILLFVGSLYQNCGQTPLGALNLSSESSENSSSSSEPNIVSTPYALLSSEQVFKSMASVTGTTFNGTLINEYNSRQAVLGSGYDLKLITSPMLIAVANLASVFCNETLNREIAQTADARRFFSQIDFGKPIGSISDSAFQSTVRSLSSAFWGRSPSDLELQILADGKSDFLSGLSETEVKQNSTSKNFMLYTCTAMLSSFDTLSF